MIKKEVEDKKIDFNFNISYAFCISTFLQNKFNSMQTKYNIIKEIMLEDDINIFYGEENNYFNQLLEWIKS